MPKKKPYAPEKPRAYPRFVRAEQHRVVAGVSSGLSAHLGVDVTWVRIFFTVTSLLGGLGIFFYAAVWMFTPLGTPTQPIVDGKKLGQAVNWLLVVGALALWLTSTSAVGDTGDGVVLAVVIVVAVGAVLAWRAYDRDMRTAGSIASFIVGGVLVMGGVIVLAAMGDSGGLIGVVIAVLIAVLGVGILVVPLIARLLRTLVNERQDKAVADHRAEIAAHLHDSVLQTLALIQKRAGDSDEVARLARRQERELRAWLYDVTPTAPHHAPAAPVTVAPSGALAPGSAGGVGVTGATGAAGAAGPGIAAAPTLPLGPPAPATVFMALKAAAGEVEDLFGVRIQPVTVGGDVRFSGAVEPLILAAREAMVNAGKHSGQESIDVYAEHVTGADRIDVYVRDRGIGFDAGAIPQDRHGVRESITDRMVRAGGSAVITTAPGRGTEVELSLPLTPARPL